MNYSNMFNSKMNIFQLYNDENKIYINFIINNTGSIPLLVDY